MRSRQRLRAFWSAAGLCLELYPVEQHEFANQTFASIGLTPGTYTWTWGSGSNADSLTVQIGPAAVPEPASVLVVEVGFLGLAAVRHRCGKSRKQT
jgi:hypothetical protein